MLYNSILEKSKWLIPQGRIGAINLNSLIYIYLSMKLHFAQGMNIYIDSLIKFLSIIVISPIYLLIIF